jgi:hypothetical protein
MPWSPRRPARESPRSGLAASTDAVYAMWTDGRNNSIGETGLGETDIFTKVQKSP